MGGITKYWNWYAGIFRDQQSLTSARGELVNNTSKLTGIDELIKKDSKKIKEVSTDPSYSEVQRPLYSDRVDALKPEQQKCFEVTESKRSLNAGYKPTIDEEKLLAERIRT